MSDTIQSGMVSIIVASYNHAQYLEERMNSLVSQTYQNIEILVIDDCSTDNSVEILRGYEKHPKVRLIVREENGGWVAVSNQGVDISLGQYILFANCDDSCEIEMVEALVDGIKDKAGIGISYCRSSLIDSVGRVLGNDFLGREKLFQDKCTGNVVISKHEMARFLLDSCVIPNLSAALIDKKRFIFSGGLKEEYKVCSDWDLFFRIIQNSDVFYVAKELNKFRQHKKTIRSSVKQKIIYQEIVKLLFTWVDIINLTRLEYIKYKFHTMYLVAIYFSEIPKSTINIPALIKYIFLIKPSAILYLFFAFIYRIFEIIIKIPKKIIKLLK
jgi:glycosyltransferase involved in cell wall biosynthesis